MHFVCIPCFRDMFQLYVYLLCPFIHPHKVIHHNYVVPGSWIAIILYQLVARSHLLIPTSYSVLLHLVSLWSCLILIARSIQRWLPFCHFSWYFICCLLWSMCKDKVCNVHIITYVYIYLFQYLCTYTNHIYVSMLI